MKRYNLYNLMSFLFAMMPLLILILSGCVAQSKYLAQVAETESAKAAFQDEAKKNAALNEQISRLNNTLAEQKAKIEKLEKEKVEANRKIDELSSTINGLNADLEKAKDASRSDIDRFMSDITKLQGERDEAKKKIEELSSELDRLTLKEREARGKITEISSELKQSQEQAKATSPEDEKLREEAARLETEREELKKKVEKLSSEIDRLTSELSASMTENGKLKGKIEDLSSRVSNLNSELEKAKEAAAPVPAPIVQAPSDEGMRSEIARLEKEKAELKGKIDTLSSEVSNLNSELEKAKATPVQTPAPIVQAPNEAAAPVPAPIVQVPSDEGMRSEIARLEKEKADLEKRIEELSAEGKRLASELDRAKDSISSSELERAKDAEAVGRLKNEMARLEEEKRMAEKKKDELEAELKRTSSELEATKEEAARKQRELEEVKGTYESLLGKLKREVEGGNIKIEMMKEGLSVKIMGKVLFASGDDKLSKQGREVLDRVSGILKDVKEKMVRVEGHADNKPIGPKIIDRFPTNWELSTARATQVVRYLAKGGIDPKMLSAAGLSMYYPVATNDTKEGREQNRRIEIILYPKELTRVE